MGMKLEVMKPKAIVNHEAEAEASTFWKHESEAEALALRILAIHDPKIS